VTIGEDMSVLIGYLRVSKADGSQTLGPQRDALAAGVSPEHQDEDHDMTRAHPGSVCRIPTIPRALRF
jgi:hypothetical protein